MSELLVLEDAILAQGAELPDELCPVFLVALGLRLGGEAASVAAHVREELKAERWYGPFDPEAIHRELCARRGYKGQLFEGLLLEEVQSAVRFHAESLRQLEEVGLFEAVGDDDWQRLRTLYRSRDGLFQLFEDGRACWLTPKSRTARSFNKCVQSRIWREFVARPEGRRLDPRLKAQGWRAPDNLLREQLWHEHSRKHRERWLAKGPQPEPKRHAHRWERAAGSDLDRCKSCGVWRYLARPGSLYRYVAGNAQQVQIARETGQGRLKRPPLCQREST